MSVKKAMVIGAGQMGGGIAQVMAAAGIETYLNDINLQIVNSRLEFINKLLDKDIAKGRMDDLQKKETMARLIPSDLSLIHIFVLPFMACALAIVLFQLFPALP